MTRWRLRRGPLGDLLITSNPKTIKQRIRQNVNKVLETITMKISHFEWKQSVLEAQVPNDVKWTYGALWT